MTTSRTRQVILITDADHATGEAIARHLASDGHRVMLGARSVARVAFLARDIVQTGGTATYQELDPASHGSTRAFLVVAEACFGRIDALVNTSGMAAGIVAVLPVVKAQGLAQVIHVPTDHALHPRAIAEQVGQAVGLRGRAGIGEASFAGGRGCRAPHTS